MSSALRILNNCLFVAFILGLGGTQPGHSATIIGQSSLNPDGSYTYDYSINPEGKLITNWGLDFTLPGADWQLNDILLPPGWIVDWSVASGKPDLDFIDVSGLGAGPNDILSGFSFHSFYRPGQVGFVAFGLLSASGSGEFGVQGSVIGPVVSSGGSTVPDALPGIFGSLLIIALLFLANRSQSNKLVKVGPPLRGGRAGS